MSDDLRPFAFEDLPLNSYGKRIEPEKWGPTYTKPVKRAKPVNDETRIPTNCASGQKSQFDAAKHRAKIKAEFAAAAATAKRQWANGEITGFAVGEHHLRIEDVYEAAMAAKRARELRLAA